MQPEISSKLELALLAILSSQPAMQEIDLLKALEARGFDAFSPSHKLLALFQSHFLLFHTLYRLQDKWEQEALGQLRISMTRIEFSRHPKNNKLKANGLPTKSRLTDDTPKAVKDYYLNYDHFITTQEQTVVELITDFWHNLYPSAPLKQNDLTLQSAFIFFDLEPTKDARLIQRQFKRLANKFHPDKGGDPEVFKQLVIYKSLLLAQATPD